MADLRSESQPLAYAVKDAARAIGISPALLEQFIARGDINPQWAKSKRVIDADELTAFVKSLPYDRPTS